APSPRPAGPAMATVWPAMTRFHARPGRVVTVVFEASLPPAPTTRRVTRWPGADERTQAEATHRCPFPASGGTGGRASGPAAAVARSEPLPAVQVLLEAPVDDQVAVGARPRGPRGRPGQVAARSPRRRVRLLGRADQ